MSTVDAIQAVREIHKPIGIYDECDCPEGTHPDSYDYVYCEDYEGCHNSFMYWACSECCMDGGYHAERCADGHDHDKDEAHRCPTIRAITKALEA